MTNKLFVTSVVNHGSDDGATKLDVTIGGIGPSGIPGYDNTEIMRVWVWPDGSTRSKLVSPSRGVRPDNTKLRPVAVRAARATLSA